MKEKILRYLSFGSLAAVVILMMAATVIEKLNGTPAAFAAVYHHPLFIALWAVTALSGLLYLAVKKVPRRFATFALHIAFVLILAGALVTHLTGDEGEMVLQPSEPCRSFVREDGSQQELPFALRLEDFTVEYYRGSKAPSDFRSTVTVVDETPRTETISMNNILKHRGYRFYQSDYDMEAGTSTLFVSHDPAGVGVTYAGYLLLLLSMVAFFFEKGSRFRTILRRVAASGAAVLLLFAAAEPASARPAVDTPKALPSEVADAFGDLYVYYNDRICPLNTQNRDYCLKAYGKGHWEEYSADQAVTGWLFYYDWWRVVPFKLKAKDRAGMGEREKRHLLESVAAGEAWKIFPVRDSLGTVNWYSATDELPAEVVADFDLWTFIRKSLDLVNESVRAEDWDRVSQLVGKIRAYQEKTAGDVLPSAGKFRAEKVYNRISRPMLPFMATITLGLVLFVLMGIAVSRNRRLPLLLEKGSVVLSGVLLIYLTLVLGLRWFVSGHAPFAGSYSVMMLMAWLSCWAVLLLWKRLPLMIPLGYLMAGFTMLMASLSSANPRITHMMPVLQSPLLSVHVLCMMLSYTLLGLAALNGMMGLALLRKKDASVRLMDVSLVNLYPAVFLLTAGTFIGAVWANISWGGYWGWDPKETWALITLLVYAFALHGGSIKVFQKPLFFHLYTILAFLAVLITYFGVNLILGGMHAYA